MRPRTPATVLIAATLDTKSEEALFLRGEIEEHGLATKIVDCGILGKPGLAADVPRAAIAERVGLSLRELVASGDKGRMIAAMTRGLGALVGDLWRGGAIDGVIAVGGGQGTAIATSAMQELPLGFPKVMVTTLAGRDMRRFVGTKDIAVFPSVADMLGLNDILRATLGNAAHAIAGMVEARATTARAPDTARHPAGRRAVIGATALGTTTSGLSMLRTILHDSKVEVAFFHANGIGGCSMEDLARAGHFDLLLEWTPHELLDHAVGGIFAGPAGRMDVLAERDIPCVVSCGAMDYRVEGASEELQDPLRARLHVVHNHNITLVRATREEMVRGAELLAAKLNRALGPVHVLVPQRGFCEPNFVGKPFHDPAADAAFIAALRAALRPSVVLVEVDAHINDEPFVRVAAETVLSLLPRGRSEALP